MTPPVPSASSVEVGWRLARWAWGHGYASEAARATLRYGFETLNLDEIVSFTAVPNTRSQAIGAGRTVTEAGSLTRPPVTTGRPFANRSWGDNGSKELP